MGMRTERHRKVGHLREVQHLFHAHAQQRLAPARDALALRQAQIFGVVPFEAEQGEQVPAQQIVFKLGCLCQQVKKLLACRDVFHGAFQGRPPFGCRGIVVRIVIQGRRARADAKKIDWPWFDGDTLKRQSLRRLVDRRFERR